ncbi:MAG TPA: type III-B CRISPR module-associated Cmr3 family protein [Bryobacteraceae bacterium]|jgi:CRISPR-associated protein Cmr3|nr:type III-B CRISPR module-associated Cmr3 family protein [Bryobacteraceae bacterium]
MTRVHVALLPRDGFFCKDGRGWFTSASGRGHGIEWPWPSTILGSIRTAWGRAEEDRANTSFDPNAWLTRTAPIQLGRILALRRPHAAAWQSEHVTWPVPLDAVWFEEEPELHRLNPQPPELPTLGREDDAAREALWRPSPARSEKPVKLPRWWSNADMAAWLAGKPVPAPARPALCLVRRLQVRIGIHSEELTADGGALFSHDVVETIEPQAEWAIGVEASIPGDALPPVATLGSDARPIRIEPLPKNLFDPPDELLAAFRQGSAGLRMVVVTPACFEKGWLPDGLIQHGNEYRGRVAGLGEVILRAAFVPRPMHISGWDMAAGTPKVTARMVAPGAVYFFERVDGRPFEENEARALWLSAIGARTEEGFGYVIPGVWSPKRSNQ